MRALRLVVPALGAATLALSLGTFAAAAPATPSGAATVPSAIVPPRTTVTTGCTADGHGRVTIVETNLNPVAVELGAFIFLPDGKPAVGPVASDARQVASGSTVTFTLITPPGTYQAVARVSGSTSVMDVKQTVTVPTCSANAPAPSPTQPGLANTGGQA